jgi:GAF domain-containing protein
MMDGATSWAPSMSVAWGGTESHFDAAEFEMAELFARQASIALLNADQHGAVATPAETDALTGLHNRGAFEEHIAALLEDPGAQSLTLLMLDLDGFKSLNDRQGHLAGDAVLRKVQARSGPRFEPVIAPAATDGTSSPSCCRPRPERWGRRSPSESGPASPGSRPKQAAGSR